VIGLLSDVVESSAVGRQLVQVGSCSDRQRGLEAVNTEAEGSTVLKPLPDND
jgi:hypothetical protein